MAAFPWAAVASGGSGIVGPIITGTQNRREARIARARDETLAFLAEAANNMQWNKENEYSEKVWNMQNAYNEQMWHKVNAYNHPMAQMARYKEAGLNPNLIYGQSNTAPAIATGNFQNNKLDSVTQKPTEPVKWDFNNWNPMEDYMRFRNVAAQTNLLDEQAKVNQQEVLKKAAETQNINTNNEIGRENLNVIKKTSLQAATTDIEKKQADISKINSDIDRNKEEMRVLKNRDEREAASNSASISEAYERIKMMRKQGISEDMKQKLMLLDLELKQYGIQPNDNLFMRILGRLLDGKDVGTVIDNLSNNPAIWFGH